MPADDMIRASDADREHTVAVLSAGYSAGRLTLSEFDDRTTAAFTSRTWGELRRLTWDLPTWPGPAGQLCGNPRGQERTGGAADGAPLASRAGTAQVLAVALYWLALSVAAHAADVLIPAVLVLLAAARSSRNSVRCRPRAPAAGTWTGPTSDSASRTAPAFSAPVARTHTSRAERIAGRVRLSRSGGGLGAADGHHWPLVVERGQPGEQRGYMPVRADAEQQHVKRRHRAVIFGPGGRRQPAGVPRGRRLRVVAVWAVRARHRPHPGRVRVQVPQQRCPCPGLVPLRMPGGQEPLVAPPDVQPPPVHRVPGRRRRELSQHRGADPAAGEHQ